jgi:hypothetical protein
MQLEKPFSLELNISQRTLDSVMFASGYFAGAFFTADKRLLLWFMFATSWLLCLMHYQKITMNKIV